MTFDPTYAPPGHIAVISITCTPCEYCDLVLEDCTQYKIGCYPMDRPDQSYCYFKKVADEKHNS